jgi:hypothetical protein
MSASRVLEEQQHQPAFSSQIWFVTYLTLLLLLFVFAVTCSVPALLQR